MDNLKSGTGEDTEPSTDWVGFGPDDEYDTLDRCEHCEGAYGRVEECSTCDGDGFVLKKGPDW